MIDSGEQNPVLAHHMTWIHNFPKCDSCVTMNAAGRGRPTQERRHLPHEAGHHHPVSMETGESLDGSRSSESFLPVIVQGRSMERKQRFEISSNQFSDRCRGVGSSQISTEHTQLPHPTSSNLLPLISTRNRSNDNRSPTTQFKMGITSAQQRLAKSLDLEEHRKTRVKRRVSLPSLTSDNLKLASGSSRISGTSASDSGVYDITHEEDEETLLSRISLEETDSEDEQSNLHLTIDPFPYQSERSPYESGVDTASPKPPTPVKPKKKKKKVKPAPPPPPKPRPRKAKKPYKKKRQINFVALRRHEQEVARRHPIKKQFLYSNVLESELQSYIPPRIPGGRLKPVYKRTQTGDIMIPNDPIIVHYAELKNEAEEDNQSPWQRRRQEALQAFLERRRKLLKRVSSRDKKKRVRFILPPGHVDSSSEKDDDEGKSDDENGADHGSGDEVANGESPGTTPGNDDDDVRVPRVSIVVEEALRSLEGTPSRKDSDELVQNWLQTTEGNNTNDRVLVERTSITDQFVKLPKISENTASPMISENPFGQEHEANNDIVAVTEVPDQTEVS